MKRFLSQVVPLHEEVLAHVPALGKVFDIERDSVFEESKNSVIVHKELYLLLISGLKGTLFLVKDSNYYWAGVLCASLVEDVIIATYLRDHKRINDYLYYSVIEKLKDVEKLTGEEKVFILRELENPSNRESFERLKRKDKKFLSDEDYLERKNYKKAWKPPIKNICCEIASDGKNSGLYLLYERFCNYKHFSSRSVMQIDENNQWEVQCCLLLIDSYLIDWIQFYHDRLHIFIAYGVQAMGLEQLYRAYIHITETLQQLEKPRLQVERLLEECFAILKKHKSSTARYRVVL